MASLKKVDVPQAGDIATHYSGELDPRTVAMAADGLVWLELSPPASSTAAGPFLASNYTFERKVQD